MLICDNSDGNVPLKLLKAKFNDSRDSINPNSVGKVPWNPFKLKSIDLKLSILKICVGRKSVSGMGMFSEPRNTDFKSESRAISGGKAGFTNAIGRNTNVICS